MVEYRPYPERAASTQYRDVLAGVLAEGLPVPTRQGPAALTLMQQTMRFPLAEGFPVITERSIRGFWRKAIGELCAFINGATTLVELEKFGCDWWDPWATPEKTLKKGLPPGDIGPGSYGGAFHDFPTSEGPGFDQFAHLVEQIRELPHDRTHFVSPWIPQYQVRGTVSGLPAKELKIDGQLNPADGIPFNKHGVLLWNKEIGNPVRASMLLFQRGEQCIVG